VLTADGGGGRVPPIPVQPPRASRIRFRCVGDTNARRGRGIAAAWFGSVAWWFRRR